MRWPWRRLTTTKERRKSPRVPMDGVVAAYWDGSANSLHRVREISLSGAFIETDALWGAGTIMRVAIRFLRQNDSDCDIYSPVWCRVVRGTSEGLGVEFITAKKGEKIQLRRFLEN